MANSSEPLLYLVLQGQYAVWLSLRNGQVNDARVERINEDGALSDKPVSRFASSESAGLTKRLRVNLILNTPLEELEIVSCSTGKSIINAWVERLRHLSFHRNSDYQTSVIPLPSDCFPAIGVALKHIIPDPWTQWLIRLQDQGVSIISVATVTELLLPWAKAQNHLVLVDCPVGDERRHLGVLGGVPVFHRLVPALDVCQPVSRDQQVQESLQQFESQSCVQERAPVKLLQFDTVSEAGPERGSSAREILQAKMFCQLMPEQQGKVVSHTSGSHHDGFEQTNPVLVDGRLIEIGIDNTDTGCRSTQPPDGRSALSRLKYRLSALAQFSPASSSWSPLRREWRSSEALQPSVRHLHQITRLHRLNVLTVGLAVLGSLMLILSSLSAMQGGIVRNKLELQEQDNRNKAVQIREQLMSQHPAADEIARKTLLLDQLSSFEPISPSQVTTLVANALTPLHEISLDELVWTAVDDFDSHEQLFSSLDKAPARQWQGNRWLEQESRVRVELNGLVSGNDLLEQQRAFDQLVLRLQRQRLVSAVKVMQAPADAARRSRLISGQATQYRILLDVEGQG